MDDTGERQLAGEKNFNYPEMKAIRIIIWLLLFTQLLSCIHKFDQNDDYIIAYDSLSPQKSDTITVTHSECTECSDMYILEGSLTINPKLDIAKKYATAKDVKICGLFPIDLIDMNSWNYKSGSKFIITGKVVTIDTLNALGPTPVFFVEGWSEIK